MTEEESVLISLGEEAKAFMKSPLGVYISNRAEIVVENCKQTLSKINPEDVKGIKYLQAEIARYENFDQWIQEAIFTGNTTYEQYLAEFE